MGDAFAWIGQIVEWFGMFIPRRIILDTTEGAVKYVRGYRVVVLGAGFHWYWPLTTTLVQYPVSEQTDRLESQVMESADGKTFLVSGTFTYRVVNLEKLVPTTHSPATMTIDIANLAIHDVLCEYNWDDIQRLQRRDLLKTQLRNQAQKLLLDKGIEVIRLKLNSLARCRVLKISQSTSSEEN